MWSRKPGDVVSTVGPFGDFHVKDREHTIIGPRPDDLRAEALIQPYKPVVDIDLARLPSVDTVGAWSSRDFVAALSHDASNPQYDRQFRQFMHVSFKIAAEMGSRFTDALETHREIVGRRVRDNLLGKHITPIFG